MELQEDRRKTIKAWLFIIILLVILTGIFVLYWYFHTIRYTSDDIRRADIAEVNSVHPECLLLSMFPTENFSAEDFEHYRGTSTVKASHRFENLYDIRDFFSTLDAAPPNVYIAVDAASIASLYSFHASLYSRVYSDTLLSTIREHTSTAYEILLPYYSLEYWRTLSEVEREDVINSYGDFVNIFYNEPNVKIYFAGDKEWIIANPGNYETENSCNEAVTRKIVAFTICDDSYILTPENMEDKFSLIHNLSENISSVPLLAEYDFGQSVDLSDMDIVFFGDSVIGNFTDSASIPGVVAGLSGAKAYNLGVGGTTATLRGESDDASLCRVVEAFLNGDSSRFSEEQQVKRGIEEYVSAHADGEFGATCFIINYGLNDFFEGMPVNNPLTEEEAACYAGALRHAVGLLQEAYPDCRIILMTPTYCSYYNGGIDPQSSDGGVLRDYVDAVFNVAEEMDVECIDNYDEPGFDSDNFETYLSDGCHPNELGRYVIGRHILQHFLLEAQE